jgi:putative ABC transport system permease protein
MFGRLVFQLLRGNRGRLVIALVALASGATMISALLNLEFDIGRKLTREFRILGANVVLAPRNRSLSGGPGATAPSLMEEARVRAGVDKAKTKDVFAAVPFLYIVARASGTPFVVAGTQLEELEKLEPTWKMEGQWPAADSSASACLMGRSVARRFHLALGDPFEMRYQDRSATFKVAGIIDAGGSEDDQVFVSLPAAQELAGLPGKITLMQFGVTGTRSAIEYFVSRLSQALPEFDAQPIRQIAEAEGQLLGKTQLLVVSMALLILILTALCVLGTMAALAMERRIDVGLMKALGGSIARVMNLFLAEVGVLGATGGLIGCVLGFALSNWMGRRVFSASISPRWEVFPLTIGLMLLVALTGALPLRLLGKVKPANILRGE